MKTLPHGWRVLNGRANGKGRRRAPSRRGWRGQLLGTVQWAVVLLAGLFAWKLYTASPDLVAAARQGWGLGDSVAARSSPTAPANAIVGRASVIDGDTLEIRRARVRLHAVDAPESRQTCQIDGQSWPCGRRAASALAELIGVRNVACAQRDTDRYGRAVAKCRVGDTDLGAWMVEHGWALAYRQYGVDYVAEEVVARVARRGVWQGTFVPPWRFRQGDRDEVGVVSYSLE
jgi:endonuclease YncB( thermonuclease family)